MAINNGSLPGAPNRAQHTFARAPQASIPRSQFSRSHGHKTTFDAGYLIPIFVDEALPGDTFNLRMSAFARVATLLFPVMDNMYLDSHFFAVPYRLVWNNWQKFNGEQANPGDSTDFLVPVMTSPAGGYLNGTLNDYLGIPTQLAGLTHTSLVHRAYNLIWNEWFRDENLQNSVTVDKGDGPDNPANYVLLKRGKRHDYFTSCLPFPQKGPAVQLPLGTSATVKLNPAPSGFQVIRNSATGALIPNIAALGSNAASQLVQVAGGIGADLDPAGTLYADLSTATAATINSLRQAFQVQKLYERDARGGTRYTEIVKSHFGVISPDARLQRPEYIGGGSSPVIISPIAQTSSAAAQPSPLATLSAFGTCTANNHGFTKSFTEHCIILGMISVRADLNYQQGLNKMFSRRARFDFYWPALSHIGEQAVLNKEIYAQATAVDDQVFGYQERYAEYRYKPSLITGQFRSNFATPLDAWHLAQNFSGLPLLNDSFIQESPPVDRVKALANTYPDFLFDSWFNIKCARPMPVYSVPGLVDHF